MLKLISKPELHSTKIAMLRLLDRFMGNSIMMKQKGSIETIKQT